MPDNQPMKLTASQIRELDEINFDRQANESMFKIAMAHFTNRSNELGKIEKKWWIGLAEIHGFDLDSADYTLDKIENAVCIVKIIKK